MALYGGFDQTKHFEELTVPLDAGGTVMTPTQRRNAALANLFAAGAGAVSFTGSVTVAGTGGVTSPAVLTATDIGTASGISTIVATEHGDGVYHRTRLACTSLAMSQASVSGTNVSMGALVYTLPAGAIHIRRATIYGSLLNSGTDKSTSTAEVGLGTTIAGTGSATLVTTGENIIDGGVAGATGGAATATDCNGTVWVKVNDEHGGFVMASGGAHTVYFNVAAAWGNNTSGNITFTGNIDLEWWKLS